MKAYASTDIEGLYTLGTVVVDYRGYRVTAQSIIPGRYTLDANFTPDTTEINSSKLTVAKFAAH